MGGFLQSQFCSDKCQNSKQSTEREQSASASCQSWELFDVCVLQVSVGTSASLLIKFR